jgi:hypothetical protein
MASCVECQYYIEPECRRYPPGERGFVRVSGGSWCGEFKEVVVCPVEEKVKVEEVKVEEKAEVSEPEVKKRGWPLGKSRKGNKLESDNQQ